MVVVAVVVRGTVGGSADSSADGDPNYGSEGESESERVLTVVTSGPGAGGRGWVL